ncbi:VRR-NUC domain-containing protein [Arthrobacter sp. SDTb3-6]|uniref:VRR-NUC domain-containing protein n=1 Tax=Arthrobacter sp. SDTb3-6 TaxID=2713571 RepID=UPI00159D450B|nr:VRR-NUC domain-containing protein [Arthrobacter sp. SDTb3-6]NVM97816.1 VRR-NUC domain-containing protein [Arthrobacter sp. SDTb3-6]
MSGEQVTRVMTGAEFRAQQYARMTEAAFQSHVERLARWHRWDFFHVYNSRRSRPGYPDLHLWHPVHGSMFRELKTMKGRQSPAQLEVEASMRAAGIDVGVWRPADLDGRIDDELRGMKG